MLESSDPYMRSGAGAKMRRDECTWLESASDQGRTSSGIAQSSNKKREIRIEAKLTE